jgi:CDP-diacylglycerol--serine O-phosphatidyltransferase
MILGAYNAACLLTLAGLVAAVAAIALATSGRLEFALVGLMLAGLADLFDGVVARRIDRGPYEREFGVQLDSVVDVASFVVTPVVLALAAGLRGPAGVVALALFALAGVVRLAHFNTLSAQGADQSTHHRGLPVTYTSLIVPVLFLLRDVVSAAVFRGLLGVAFVVVAAAFVMDVPVRKPRGPVYALFPAVGAVLIAYWLWRGLTATP